VKFIDVLEGRLKGVVDREPRRRNDTFSGRLSYLPQHENAKPEFVDFDLEDIDKRCFLRLGDKLEFNLAIDKRTKTKKATNIILQREIGKIDSISNRTGLIRCDDQTREDKLFFHLQDVQEGVQLHAGDVVEFLVVFNSRQKSFSAQDIRLYQEMIPKTVIKRAETKETLVVLRQPLAPGTTPFGVGRGKFLPEDREKLRSNYLSGLFGHSSSPDTERK